MPRKSGCSICRKAAPSSPIKGAAPATRRRPARAAPPAASSWPATHLPPAQHRLLFWAASVEQPALRVKQPGAFGAAAGRLRLGAQFVSYAGTQLQQRAREGSGLGSAGQRPQGPSAATITRGRAYAASLACVRSCGSGARQATVSGFARRLTCSLCGFELLIFALADRAYPLCPGCYTAPRDAASDAAAGTAPRAALAAPVVGGPSLGPGCTPHLGAARCPLPVRPPPHARTCFAPCPWRRVRCSTCRICCLVTGLDASCQSCCLPHRACRTSAQSTHPAVIALQLAPCPQCEHRQGAWLLSGVPARVEPTMWGCAELNIAHPRRWAARRRVASGLRRSVCSSCPAPQGHVFCRGGTKVAGQFLKRATCLTRVLRCRGADPTNHRRFCCSHCTLLALLPESVHKARVKDRITPAALKPASAARKNPAAQPLCRLHPLERAQPRAPSGFGYGRRWHCSTPSAAVGAASSTSPSTRSRRPCSFLLSFPTVAFFPTLSSMTITAQWRTPALMALLCIGTHAPAQKHDDR